MTSDREIKKMEKQIEALGNKSIKDLKLTEDWQIDYLMHFEVQVTLLQDVITEQKVRQDLMKKFWEFTIKNDSTGRVINLEHFIKLFEDWETLKTKTELKPNDK